MNAKRVIALRETWQAVVLGTTCIVFSYPIALIPVVLLDGLAGESEFQRFLMVAGVMDAIGVVASDWWSALPLAMSLWLIARAAFRFAGARYFYRGGIGLALLASALAVQPPYLPLIFPSMLLAILLLSVIYERCRASN